MKKYLILIVLIGPRLHTKEIDTYYVDYNTEHHDLSIVTPPDDNIVGALTLIVAALGKYILYIFVFLIHH